ncbi:hypothetical protein ISCGN_009596 [Ixodes scapularis]
MRRTERHPSERLRESRDSRRTPRRQLMREAPGVKGLKKDATASADGEPRQYLREKTAAIACCVVCGGRSGIPARGSGSQGTQEERTPRRQLMREAPGVKGLKKDATASADGEPRQYLREKTAAIACCVVCGGRSGIPARGSGSQGTQEERTPRRQLMPVASYAADGAASQREAPGVKGLKKDATASADGEPRQYLREKTAAIACCVVCGGRSGIPARGSGSQGTQETDATASADGEPRQYLREKTAAIACCVVCGGRSGIPARGSGSQGTQEGRHGVS